MEHPGRSSRQLGDSAGVVVAGDFNDVSASPAYAAILDPAAGLRSAYATFDDGREPPWTTWKVREGGTVKRTIDYIFYRKAVLRPVAMLDAPSDADVGEGGLPSWRYPSDHLGLLVRFVRTV